MKPLLNRLAPPALEQPAKLVRSTEADVATATGQLHQATADLEKVTAAYRQARTKAAEEGSEFPPDPVPDKARLVEEAKVRLAAKQRLHREAWGSYVTALLINSEAADELLRAQGEEATAKVAEAGAAYLAARKELDSILAIREWLHRLNTPLRNGRKPEPANASDPNRAALPPELDPRVGFDGVRPEILAQIIASDSGRLAHQSELFAKGPRSLAGKL